MGVNSLPLYGRKRRKGRGERGGNLDPQCACMEQALIASFIDLVGISAESCNWSDLDQGEGRYVLSWLFIDSLWKISGSFLMGRPCGLENE